MEIKIPFDFRPNLNTKCGCCGHIQKIMPSINFKKYVSAPEYFDGFKIGFETEYFVKKFEFCEKCDNFGKAICCNFTKDFNNEKIQGILKSSLSKIEKALAIQIELFPKDIQGYLDLYWFYDLTNVDENLLNLYRNILIEQIEILYKKKHSIRHLALIIELYRRKGDFETALKYSEKLEDYKNSSKFRENIGITFTETMVIKEEIDLCKRKNSCRERLTLKNYYPRDFS